MMLFVQIIFWAEAKNSTTNPPQTVATTTCAPPENTPYETSGKTVFGPNSRYTFAVSGPTPTQFQWRFSASVSAVSANSGSTFWFNTDSYFKGGYVEVSTKLSCSDWSTWKRIDLPINPVPPTVTMTLNVPSDGVVPEQSYHCVGSGALNLEWKVIGGGVETYASTNVMNFTAKSGYPTVTIQMRGNNNGPWSAWVSKDVPVKVVCAAPASIAITTSLDGTNPCMGSSGTASFKGVAAESYTWQIGTGCFTYTGSDCFTSISRSPYNALNFNLGTSAFTNSLTTTIVLTAYYCNGTKSVSTAKYITSSKSSCFRIGSEEYSNEESFVLYPNPATDKLQASGCENIRIVSSTGVVVYEFNSAVESVDVSSLSKGLYLFTATKNGLPIKLMFEKE
jgi:hypothetical protein